MISQVLWTMGLGFLAQCTILIAIWLTLNEVRKCLEVDTIKRTGMYEKLREDVLRARNTVPGNPQEPAVITPAAKITPATEAPGLSLTTAGTSLKSS